MPHHIILYDMDTQWELLVETHSLQAELLKSFLEAQEIPTQLFQEGAGKAMGLTVGPLGLVQVLVPVEMLDSAEKAMDAFFDENTQGEMPEEQEQDEI